MIVLRWVLDLEHHLGIGVERLDLLVPEEKSDISIRILIGIHNHHNHIFPEDVSIT